MKIILLDIDGVMVPAKSWEAPEFLEDGFYKFNQNSTNVLNKMLKEIKASIILTSSHKSTYNNLEWGDIFKLRATDVHIDRLADNILNLSRCGEINNWITNHTFIKNFVIIDDDKSLDKLTSVNKNKLFLTDSLIGLNSAMVDNIILMLNNENK